MRGFFLLLIALAACPTRMHAAFSQPSTSPALAACGGTLAGSEFTAAMILHTPASICLSGKTAIELAGQRLYSIPQLDSYIAAAGFRFRKWGVAGAVLSTGDADLYLETRVTGCVGFSPAGYLSTGIAVSYNCAEMGEGYGNAGCLSFGAGVILVPSSHWRLNLSLRNPFEPGLLGSTRLRREVSAGTTITRFRDVSFATEISSRSGEHSRFRIGEVYRVSSALSLSAGVITSPFVPSLGCCISCRSLRVMYAYRYHPHLGGTHIWGIALSDH